MACVRGWCSGVAIALLVAAGCGKPSGPAKNSDLSFTEQVDLAKKDPVAESRAKKLIRIGYQQGKAKDLGAADRTFRLAVEAAKAVAESAERADVYALLTQAQAQIGNLSGAKISAAAAQQAAGAAEGDANKARAMTAAGLALGLAKELDKAAETLKQAEDAARKLPDSDLADPGKKSSLLAGLAESYQRIDRPADADRLFNDAITSAKALELDRDRCMAVAAVAVRQFKLEKKELSAKSFDLVLDMARNLAKQFTRAQCLALIALEIAKTGDVDKAWAVIEEADALAHKVPEADMQSQTVQKVRELMNQLPKKAAKNGKNGTH